MPVRVTFRHRAFQIEIDSYVELPELPPGDPRLAASLEIVEGPVADTALADAAQLGPFAWARPDRLRLRVPGVARFEISSGERIVVQPDSGIDSASVRAFLLGSVIGGALLQRGLTVLHGNAVAVDDGALICLGNSGAGKSTLALGFHRRGFAVLADDVVGVARDAAVLPGIPRIKLWQDVADHLAIDTAGLPPVRPSIRKYSLPIEGGVQSPRPVRWIGLLTQGHVDEVTIDPLQGIAAFEAITDHFYRPGLVGSMGHGGDHVAVVGKLVRQARVVRIVRPVVGFTLDALVDRVLEDARGR